MRALRTVVWSTGGVGSNAIDAVRRRPDLELVGVWVHTGPDNSQAQVVFTKDSTFSVKANDQIVNSGRWWMNNDTVSLTDKSCGPSVIETA